MGFRMVRAYVDSLRLWCGGWGRRGRMDFGVLRGGVEMEGLLACVGWLWLSIVGVFAYLFRSLFILSPSYVALHGQGVGGMW